MAHFAFENLTFSYPEGEKPVLDGVSLAIERGSYVVLCGKSGCGKTTLLRHAKSALAPQGRRSGRVLFEGELLDEVPLLRQSAEVGFVMQNPDAQLVTDKVWHELAFGLESIGTDAQTMRLRVAEMTSYFGIQEWFHREVHTLSGGQKQLVNLASVMALQPSLLVLDEPTGQLDPIAAADFLNTVSKIHRELGTTVLITEHRLEDVFPRADRVVVMEGGRVTADGSPRQVGELLHRRKDDLLDALPVPLRVFYQVQGAAPATVPAPTTPAPATALDSAPAADPADALSAEGDDASAGAAAPAADPAAPLTVREGRAWLSRLGEEHPFERTRLPEPAEPAVARCGQTPVLEVKDAWFRYRRELPDVLKGVSLRVFAGSSLAIVGGNGAGKSTLLKVLAGVERPYRGTVKAYGERVGRARVLEAGHACVALLPQDPQNLFSQDLVRDELQEMLSDAGLSAAQRQERIQDVAHLTGVAHLMDAHPFDVSGGEQQRIALAKVLLANPRILLLDEPTKGLDAHFKARLAALLQRLKQEGVALVMVSHDVEFCARHADEAALFFDGGIVASQAPRRFFACNGFYTTAANRMSRHVFENAVTDEDVVRLCTGR